MITMKEYVEQVDRAERAEADAAVFRIEMDAARKAAAQAEARVAELEAERERQEGWIEAAGHDIRRWIGRIAELEKALDELVCITHHVDLGQTAIYYRQKAIDVLRGPPALPSVSAGSPCTNPAAAYCMNDGTPCPTHPRASEALVPKCPDHPDYWGVDCDGCRAEWAQRKAAVARTNEAEQCSSVYYELAGEGYTRCQMREGHDKGHQAFGFNWYDGDRRAAKCADPACDRCGQRTAEICEPCARPEQWVSGFSEETFIEALDAALRTPEKAPKLIAWIERQRSETPSFGPQCPKGNACEHAIYLEEYQRVDAEHNAFKNIRINALEQVAAAARDVVLLSRNLDFSDAGVPSRVVRDLRDALHQLREVTPSMHEETESPETGGTPK